MELETKTIEIEGATYAVGQLPSMVCLNNSPRVIGHVSAAFEQLSGINIAGGLGQLAFVDIAKGGAALKALCDRLHPSEMEYLTGLLFRNSTVEVDGKRKPLLDYLKVNSVPGGIGALFQVLWASLELSFGPFGSLVNLFQGPAKGGDSKASTT